MTPARLDSRGASFAALAALLWGFVPVYIGLIGDVDATEIAVSYTHLTLPTNDQV